jgi:hypothetical protein
MATQTEMVEMIKELAYAISDVADTEVNLEVPTEATMEALKTAIEIVEKLGDPDGINRMLKCSLEEIQEQLEGK